MSTNAQFHAPFARGNGGRMLALAGLLALILMALFGSAVFAQEPIRGRWFLELPPVDGEVELSMHRKTGRGGRSQSSFDIPLGQLRGFSPPASSTDSPVRFQLVRDAGTFQFDGYADLRGGSGSFEFSPDRGFADEMKPIHGEISPDKLYSLAIHDVSRAYIRELAALGYDALSLNQLIKMRIHGADPAFIRELKALGYSDLSAEDLVKMRIHGATPEFVRELRALGYKDVSANSLVKMRIHGAEPAYIREVQGLGYSGLSTESLVKMRIHDVSPEFIRDLKAIGYTQVDAGDLVKMKIHGVTPEFIRQMNAKENATLSTDELISLRIHRRS